MQPELVKKEKRESEKEDHEFLSIKNLGIRSKTTAKTLLEGANLERKRYSSWYNNYLVMCLYDGSLVKRQLNSWQQYICILLDLYNVILTQDRFHQKYKSWISTHKRIYFSGGISLLSLPGVKCLWLVKQEVTHPISIYIFLCVNVRQLLSLIQKNLWHLENCFIP